MTLEGKIALVTGAGRGIGRAIALKLASEGAAVIVNALSEQHVRDVVTAIQAAGGKASGIVANVGIAEEAYGLVDRIIADNNAIDILVNNAGITRDQILLRMTDADWDDVINIDMKSVFLCTRAVTKHMVKARKGRIVNMSSIVGITGNAGQSNYAAAKAGIIGFTRSVARELASRNITVNAVAPGFIETDMTAGLTEKQRQDILVRIPVGYIGAASDVAALVAFLASDAARYITGQVIVIDGGMSA